MALIVPSGPNWAYYTDNMPSTPSASQFGTTVTAGANDTMGTAVTCISALSHDCEYMQIFPGGYASSTNAGETIMDILFDPAGGTSWTTLISGLLVGHTRSRSTSTPSPLCYDFPIWLPSGTSIGAQAQTHLTTTDAGEVIISVRGGNRNPASWWCGQGVETIGVDRTSSQGTLITPGNSGAFSSWTSLGSPTVTTRTAGAVQFAGQGNSNNTSARAFRLEFGADSNIIGPPLNVFTNSTEDGWNMNSGLIFKQIESGEQLQVRGTSGATNTEQIGCAAYIVY